MTSKEQTVVTIETLMSVAENSNDAAERARLWQTIADLAAKKAGVSVAPGIKVRLSNDEVRLDIGQVLYHTNRTQKLAECTYRGPYEYDYKGTLYKTLSAAATACAKDLGYSSLKINGLWFWGVTKRIREKKQ